MEKDIEEEGIYFKIHFHGSITTVTYWGIQINI